MSKHFTRFLVLIEAKLYSVHAGKVLRVVKECKRV
jgi:ribosomal protein S27AE